MTDLRSAPLREGAPLTIEPERLISPKLLADALGLGEATIKRWVDQGRITAARTEGGHRRIALGDALHYIRTRQLPLSRPELLGLQSGGATPDSFERLITSESPGEAIQVLESLYASGVAPAVLADDWIAPAMAALGHGWENGSLGVTDEHQATTCLVRGMHGLLHASSSSGDRPLAFVAALDDDPYVLPGLCCELLLRDVGMRVRNFGPNTPAADLARVVEREHPVLLAMSFSLEDGSHVDARSLHALAEAARRTGCAIAIGGRGCSDPLGDALGATIWCRSMRELERIANHLLLSRPASRERA